MEDNKNVEQSFASYVDEPKKEEVNITPAQNGHIKHIKPIKKKKTALMKLTITAFVFTILAIVGSLACVFTPVIITFGYVLFLFVVFIMSVFTLFLIWLEESNRQEVGRINDWLQGLMDNSEGLVRIGSIIAIVSCVLAAITLTLAIINVAKKEKGAIPFIVISSIILVVSIVVMVVGFNVEFNA